MSAKLKAILVRVGVDHSYGAWNAPVNPKTGQFVFVPITASAKKAYTPGNVRRYDEMDTPLPEFATECDETYILCRSTARREKEQAIRSRFSQRMEKSLSALQKRVCEDKLRDRNQIERQLGAIQARHPQVADLYELAVVEPQGQLQLKWELRKQRRAWQYRPQRWLARSFCNWAEAPFVFTPGPVEKD